MRISDWSSDVCSSDLKSVNARLTRSPSAAERVFGRAQRQPDRHCTETEIAADAVDQIALIAVGKLIVPRAEQHEAGGARLGLRQIAQLDPLAAGRGRRLGIDRAFEPAVEFAGADHARPCLAARTST